MNRGQKMNRIINILMERDGLTEKEAKDQLAEVRKMIEECNYEPVETEEIVSSELGLEMDYIFDIIW